jgi:hypothetical protein
MGSDGGSRLQSFLLGGILGGFAGLVAGRLGSGRRERRAPTPTGLAAFERAPCYQELLEQQARPPERRGN